MLALRFRGAAAPRALGGALARRACLSTDALVPADPASGKQVSTEQAKPQLDPRAVSAFTGTPKEMLQSRVVKIFKPAPSVQSATQPTVVWKMQWEDEQTQRWTNPLMGWTSTRDPLSNTHMTLEFATADDAIRFARNNGAPVGPAHPLPLARFSQPRRPHRRMEGSVRKAVEVPSIRIRAQGVVSDTDM
jgi:NADH dehydrogenase (ubiquinone) Fe-S protein 4